MPTPPFLVRLMASRGFKGRKGPEDMLVLAMATSLRAWTLEGRLRAAWTKIQAEAAWVKVDRPEAPFARLRMGKAKAMGQITGAWEFVLTWQEGSGWIEAKSLTGQLSEQQRDFRDWLKLCGIRHAVVRRPEALEPLLKEWGVLR